MSSSPSAPSSWAWRVALAALCLLGCLFGAGADPIASPDDEAMRQICLALQGHTMDCDSLECPSVWPLYECNDTTRRVTELFLYSFEEDSLAGMLSPYVGNLSELKHLQIEDNQVSGSIPPEITSCSQLEVLHLENTGMTGSLPSDIGNLQQLKELRIMWTALEGPIPSSIGNCYNLQILKIHETGLSGPIPSAISNLTSLEELQLSFTPLTGPVPREIESLVNLKWLTMVDLDLEGTLPSDIDWPPSLIDLSIGYISNLEGSIPESIGNLQLKALRLVGLNLNGSYPATTAQQFEMLEHLELINLQLEGGLAFPFMYHPSLQRLILEFLPNIGGPISCFGAKPDLTHMSIMETGLTGSLPSMDQLTSLQSLQLSRNGFTSFPPLLPQSLSTLILESMPISQPIPGSWCNLTSLSTLYAMILILTFTS